MDQRTVAARRIRHWIHSQAFAAACRWAASVTRISVIHFTSGIQPMDGDVVIQTRNLTKIYRDFWGRKKVRALNSLSLEVKKGEVFGLLGPNGSGKTTTLKLLLGLLFPTEGQVSILGRPASDVTKNEKIGYLPEESYLYRFLNAEETLDFYGRLFNMPADVRRERSRKLIERVGLTHARRRPLKEYSKGMTRRIGLAQALINEPELILLDEPTSGLDPIGSRDMKDMIVKLKEEGRTVVMCSHLLADVQDVCDRIAILDGGELKVLGRVQELLKDQGVTQIRTSRLPEGVVKEIETVLARHGATMLDVDHPTTNLEDLFIKTVRESAARPGQRYVPTSGNKPAA
jgi:ABC-2 type transport system ATP-binding protein